MTLYEGIYHCGNLLLSTIPKGIQLYGVTRDVCLFIQFVVRRHNFFYIEKVNKFVEIEKRDDASMSNFAEELISLNIYDKLDTNIANDPNQNYENLLKLLAMLVRSIYRRKKLNIRNPFIKNLNG